MQRVVAVDLGASSLRIATVDLDAPTLEPAVVHRYEHVPMRSSDGSLRWDWQRIVAEVLRGLELALDAGPVASIGIDTWGVDYGLLGDDGSLLSPPYCYRDERTSGWRAVVDRIGAERLYRMTGIQLMQINTIFQLASHDRGELSRARQLLMLPELLLYELTGAITGERTSAGTTALVDAATGGWSRDLLKAIEVDPAIMPPVAQAGTRAGEWRGSSVHLVGGHDTASAFLAASARTPGTVIISSGTWMLVGVERAAAEVSAEAMRANFSNEPGAFGGVRLLKNVMGLWMLDQCLKAWPGAALEPLLRGADALPAGGPTVDATDERFLAPLDMEADVRAAASLQASASREMVVRCVLDSLAAAAAGVVREIEAITGVAAEEIRVVGGGSRNWLLNRLIGEASGLRVRSGPVEATVLGNMLAQGVGLGRFSSVEEARQAL